MEHVAVEPGPVQQSVEYWVTIDSWGSREHSVTEPGDFKETVGVISSTPHLLARFIKVPFTSEKKLIEISLFFYLKMDNFPTISFLLLLRERFREYRCELMEVTF